MTDNKQHSLMNVQNNNNQKGRYPIFLGEDLGFSDAINITYPNIEKIFKKQRSAYWLEEEFSFEGDRVDLAEAPAYERDVMVFNLLAQWLMDSVASRSIIEVFGAFISNEEVHNWMLTQSWFESIHALTYSKIIRNCFIDANEVIEMGKQNIQVFERCKRIGEVFNETNRMAALYTLGEVGNTPEEITQIKGQLLKAMATLYALEQISFMASFSATFALVESGRYQGIGKAVGSILADEVLHAQGDLHCFKAMFDEPEYEGIFRAIKDEIAEIFDGVVEQELRWSSYIFSEGRKVLGLNEELLKEYVRWTAKPCYDNLGLYWDAGVLGEVPAANPLPYMDKYMDRDSIQGANQEIESNNYRVGAVVNDLQDDEVFDF